MFLELPSELIFVAVGAFLFAWILATISSKLGARHRARKRDPRDDRIRSLEAELRIARAAHDDAKTDAERLENELKETTTGFERRDNVITGQQAKLEKLTSDLRDSVRKTRELRVELTERAVLSVHAEAKLREVETELSIAHASTDMIATGVLDYSFVPDQENSNEDHGEFGDPLGERGKAIR